MEVRIKKLNDKAIIPTKGSKSSAGFDLYTIDGGIVYGFTTRMFHTGLAMEIPEGYCGKIYARSGLSSKNGIRPATCVSVIDADYRGEVGVPVHNDCEDGYYVREGERIAQIIIEKVPNIEFVEADELTDTERGMGGYGSTGKK